MKDNPISLHAVGCLLTIAAPLVPFLIAAIWVALMYAGFPLMLAWSLPVLAVGLEVAIVYGGVRFARTACTGGWGWLALGWGVAIGIGFAYSVWGLLMVSTLGT